MRPRALLEYYVYITTCLVGLEWLTSCHASIWVSAPAGEFEVFRTWSEPTRMQGIGLHRLVTP